MEIFSWFSETSVALHERFFMGAVGLWACEWVLHNFFLGFLRVLQLFCDSIFTTKLLESFWMRDSVHFQELLLVCFFFFIGKRSFWLPTLLLLCWGFFGFFLSSAWSFFFVKNSIYCWDFPIVFEVDVSKLLLRLGLELPAALLAPAPVLRGVSSPSNFLLSVDHIGCDGAQSVAAALAQNSALTLISLCRMSVAGVEVRSIAYCCIFQIAAAWLDDNDKRCPA